MQALHRVITSRYGGRDLPVTLSCRTAPACRCRRRRRWRSSRGPGKDCGRWPRPRWVRWRAPTCTATSISPAARGASSASPSRWSAPCRTAAIARGLEVASCSCISIAATGATSRITTTSPMRSTGSGSISGWCTRARISATTPRRSIRRRSRSSTTSAASSGWRRGERLLDIGCGWGGLLFHAAERYGVDATASRCRKTSSIT